MNNPVTGASRN